MKANEIKERLDRTDINSVIYWQKYYTQEKFEEYFERHLNDELTDKEYEELLDLYDYLNMILAKEYIKQFEK